VTKTVTVVGESCPDVFEFSDLGGYMTIAANEATQEGERLVAALLAPLTERREELSSLFSPW
jgi:hypothetical protein